MYTFSLVFSGYFVIAYMCRLWNLFCFRRGWSRAELAMSLSSEESRFISWTSFFSFWPHISLVPEETGLPVWHLLAFLIDYHLVDLPKRVSPGIKAADAAPRTVLNTFLGRGIASSWTTFCEPLPILDFCLWWRYAFAALALSLPSLAATSEGPRAVLFHLWTVCGLLWKGQWMVTKKHKPSGNRI